MRIHSTAFLAALALTATACSDDAPTGVSGDEAAVQQAYLDVDAGYFDENPGGDDFPEGAALTSSPGLYSAPGDPYVAPEHGGAWSSSRGTPPRWRWRCGSTAASWWTPPSTVS